MLTSRGSARKPVFDPRAAFVAARPLDWAYGDGRSEAIPALASFDPDRLGCDDFTLKRLYRTRFVAMVLDENTRRPVLRAAPSDDGLAPSAPAPQAMGPLKLKRLFASKFALVDETGQRVYDGLTRSEAERILAGTERAG